MEELPSLKNKKADFLFVDGDLPVELVNMELFNSIRDKNQAFKMI
jgi:hypothetical protein